MGRRGLHPGLDSRRRRQRLHHPAGRPRLPGRRRGTRRAQHPRADRHVLPRGQRAQPGAQRLLRDLRRRLRGRPDRRRHAHRLGLLALGLLRQHPRRHRHRAARPALHQGDRAAPRRALRHRRRTDRHPRHGLARLRLHPRRREQLGRHPGGDHLRDRARAARRLPGQRDPGGAPAGGAAAVRQPQPGAGVRGDAADGGRHVRHLLLLHAVPADLPRLQPAQDRLRLPAAGRAALRRSQDRAARPGPLRRQAGGDRRLVAHPGRRDLDHPAERLRRIRAGHPAHADPDGRRHGLDRDAAEHLHPVRRRAQGRRVRVRSAADHAAGRRQPRPVRPGHGLRHGLAAPPRRPLHRGRHGRLDAVRGLHRRRPAAGALPQAAEGERAALRHMRRYVHASGAAPGPGCRAASSYGRSGISP
ncbi:putative Uncharacterized MFS-type transporter [Actinacidiphila bryophytorum]|uniref:Uncharacterized MFS-type transporter n=1 Tax=Actinacidiphila bryophytorum TaxID=1436133 RepID=A0A9W4EC56_9ACTN|nr:putative Uncharacterized MFS-type transporter [Actinacidiphila bryophytorum]